MVPLCRRSLLDWAGAILRPERYDHSLQLALPPRHPEELVPGSFASVLRATVCVVYRETQQLPLMCGRHSVMRGPRVKRKSSFLLFGKLDKGWKNSLRVSIQLHCKKRIFMDHGIVCRLHGSTLVDVHNQRVRIFTQQPCNCEGGLWP